MNFGQAIKKLKDGANVCREGWYGHHFLTLHDPGEDEPSNEPYIIISTENGDVLPWLASQADVLAEDWVDLA